MSIRFDPREMISPPFSTCKYCSQDSLGILSIGRFNVSKRCKNCLKTDSTPLPQLSKKVIYIDQFALSQITKNLDATHRAHERVSKETFWREIFSRLDVLRRMQLIICPKSSTHWVESQLTPDHDKIKRILLQLSSGSDFQDFQIIKRTQIYNAFDFWLSHGAEAPYIPPLDKKWVTKHSIEEWTDTLLISVKTIPMADLVNEERETRNTLTKAIESYCRDIAAKGKRSFKDLLQHEVESFGGIVLLENRKHLARWANIYQNPSTDIDPLSLLPGEAVLIVRDLIELMQRSKIEEQKFYEKIDQFFKDPIMYKIPQLNIWGHLWAALGRKVQSGMQQYPGGSLLADFEMISCLMPYCDAMFVDRECAAFMSDQPHKKEFQSYAKVFSAANKDEFIQYLDDLKNSATTEHVDVIKALYGEDYEKPYLTLMNEF